MSKDKGVEVQNHDKQQGFFYDSMGEVSDGYHTFNELYEHRIALFIALMRAYPSLSWKSRKHADGSEWDGWFIAGMDLYTGPITYHLADEYWNELEDVLTLDQAPEWDGHTPADVVKRLRSWDGSQA